MKTLYLFLVLMLGAVVLQTTTAQRTFIGEPSKASQHSLNIKIGDVIYDQSSDEEYGGYIVSQFFTDAASASLSCQAADDFIVPDGETWNVGSFGVWGTWWEGSAGNPAKVDVFIYNDDNGKPGTVITSYVEQNKFYKEEWVNADNELQSYYNLKFPTPVTFTAGHYWISFQVHDSYDIAGQWGWEDKSKMNGEPWHWRNPLDGFGYGFINWTPSTSVHPFGYNLDLRFALYGESYNNDLAVLDITNPEDGELTANETVTIKIKNEGKLPQTGFNVGYTINGGAMVIENVGALSVQSESAVEYSFTTKANLSAGGFYTINAATLLVGDQKPSNDNFEKEVVNYGAIYRMVNYETTEFTTCSGTFTDMGGINGGFVEGDNGIVTIFPGEAGKKIMLTFFGAFDVSYGDGPYQALTVYDGTDVNAPVIGEWSDNSPTKPDVLKALGPTGAMTIRFVAPAWDFGEGWSAFINCYQQPGDDFEMTSFAINPTLIFTDRDITFTATVRNIGSQAQAKDVTFYVNDVPVGVVNTGLVNSTEYATVNYVYQFPASGSVVIKAAVPSDGGTDPENNYKTIQSLVYQNGLLVEMFDDGYFPPEDWTPGPAWGGSSNAYTGTGAAGCYVNTFEEDTLVTPQLVIHAGDKLTFWASTTLWWPGNLRIMWKNSETGQWSDLEYIPLGSSQFNYFEVDVTAAAGNNYIGFVGVGDVVWSSSANITIDQVISFDIEYFYYDNDMKVSEFNPFPTPSKDEPINFDVAVKNNGNNALLAGDYSVKIMQVADGADNELASVPGIACNPFQFKTHTLSCTFDHIGPAEIYAMVVLPGDQKPENDKSGVRQVYVQVAGTNMVTVGDGNTPAYDIPNPLGQSHAVSEVIYTSDLINRASSGFITGISYQFDNTNTAAILDVPIQIYIGETTESNLANGYIDGSDLTKVAETTVDFPIGVNQQLYIPLTVPYNYQGGNLCVMFYKPMVDEWISSVNWIVTEMEDDSISAYTSSYEQQFDLNNLSQIEPYHRNIMPNTTFYFANVGTVPLSGFVKDEANAPLAGVNVKVVGFDNETTSQANGSYQLNNLLAWENVIAATKYGYHDDVKNIVLYEGEANTLNFTMSLLPVVNVNAVVVGNDDAMHYLEGAQVTFDGYQNYTATVGADGTFAIPGVFGDKTYNLTITFNGFDTYSAEVTVFQTDLDLGTITLNETLMIPFYTQTEQINPGTVLVSWNSPNAGVNDMLTYDYVINNGFTAEVGEEVWLGNIFQMDPGTIKSVSMYWKKYGLTSGSVRLDLVNAAGEVFYSSAPFYTYPNSWSTVDVPNLTFEGGTFYAMVYWDGTNPELTDYLATDAWPTGTGINYGYIMYPGEAPHLLSELLPDYDYTFQMTVDIVTTGNDGGKSNQGYNIFRGPYSDINNWYSWQKINNEPVTGNEYSDGNWPQSEEGYTYGVQAVYTTGVSEISFSMPIVHNPNLTCDLPWPYTVTGQVHSINIPASANPNIFGEPLQAGDWIGVFYLDNSGNEACGGAVKVNQFGSAVINAYGDDPTTLQKDGFAANETFRWRMLDCSAYDEYPAGATYDATMPNQGHFADFGLSKLTSLQVMYCQYYSFTTGWNSVSSFIVPFEPAVEDLFAPMVNNLTILRNLTQLFWPSEGVNTIGNFDNQSGYALKTTGNVSFEICGSTFTTTEVSLEAGWHYLPVLSECPVNAMDLFGAHLADIVIVTDLIGSQVFWPAMEVYSLEYLQPGKAYKIKLVNPFTLTFPACDGKATYPAFDQLNSISTPWGEFDITPNAQSVALTTNAQSEMLKGDMIGAFDQNNKLCGFIEITGNSMPQAMMLIGDDATTTEKDGFTEGENISFRLFRANTGEEFAIEVDYDINFDNATGNYFTSSLSAINAVTMSVTGINNIGTSGISIYPNPATDFVIINVATENFAGATVIVNDTKGRTVIEKMISSSNSKLDISNLRSGVYVISIKSDSINEISKLIVR
jgi:hypothetical protein